MLICQSCGENIPEEKLFRRCPCGGILNCDNARFVFSPDASLPGIWRYASSLPVSAPMGRVTLGEGMTPLTLCPWEYEGQTARVFCKFDALSPTGSYKDRGIAVVISRLKELGVTRIVEDSSGNAGAAMAAYAAAAGIACDIFVPASASEGKCMQIAAYGATLHRIPGPREATTAAAEEAAKTVYYASHNWSPYFPEGIKTYAFEIFEQLGSTLPDNIVVPVGQGSLVNGAWRGFSEILHARGTAAGRMPRIFGVQSANCAPLYAAWQQGESEPRSIAATATMAEGIASAVPVRGAETIASIRESHGAFITTSEKEIWSAFQFFARKGFYVEPTSAAALAGVTKLFAQGLILPHETTVVLLSGSGLKATDKILQYTENPPRA